MDDANAFIKPTAQGRVRATDEYAQSFAERFIGSATTTAETSDWTQAVVPEEEGGPFVTTSAEREFGITADKSNPVDAEPQAFPEVVARAEEEEDAD